MKPELLIPAGSLDILYTAVRYGADAVYIGGESLSLRAKARNFTIGEIEQGIEYARHHGVKVYIATNIVARNADLEEARAFFLSLALVNPDALIITDPGLFSIARSVCPDIPIHISTQANNTNYGTYRFWHEQGAERAVAARELDLDEIKTIRANIPATMAIECFVHGAMCVSYSGRCLLSNYLTGRDANRGECTHPCRWQYVVMEKSRPGAYLPLDEDEDGTYLFSSHDLCMIGHLPDLISAGIDSFKVEGRMKSSLYIATITRAYRRAIDDYFHSPSRYQKNREWYIAEVNKTSHRHYSTGFFYGNPEQGSELDEGGQYLREAVYIGTVAAVDPIHGVRIEQKNKFSVGEQLEIMKPCGSDITAIVTGITDENGKEQCDAPHARQTIYLSLTATPEAGDVLRRVE
ncbi:MAG: U32 family peptidase [Lachnospiraceae bacterium]|jgi:putative protease|nr:U32 family peptidase [Lachnospiraceae bacterium]